MGKREVNRRTVLRGSGLGIALAGPMGGFGALWARERSLPTRAPRGLSTASYGPLDFVSDDRTGLPLLKLPAGFSYRSFGWTDDAMLNGQPTPDRPDGMGYVGPAHPSLKYGGPIALVRNHEINGTGVSFAPPSITYDPSAPAGTTSLVFQARNGRWFGALPSLGGTSRNCAGGPTPWGSWLTGEETLDGPEDGFQETHGWVFEVPSVAAAHPVPLRSLGRFKHEALAVDPATGYVYETEDDRYTSGFYRFRPNSPMKLFGLESGGTLEMLKVVGVQNADLQQAQVGDTFPVEWVEVEVPDLEPQTGVGPFGSFDGSTSNASGPFVQGYDAGGAQFRRLEGCWHHQGLIYFTDTEGGRPASDTGEPEGTIWCYDPLAETLRVIFESPSQAVLDNPDNITVSPRGGILLCEDGDLSGLRMQGLTPDGELFPFAENAVVLNGQVNGFFGDYRGSEWCGATFDASGKWLFANIQRPGITFAITGPWSRGTL